MNKIIQILLIGIFSITALRSQTNEYNYQVILESKAQYSNLDKKSLINPNNAAGIDELSSITQLYPILTFKHGINQLSTRLQLEGNLTNFDFNKDSIRFSFQELYVSFALKDRHFFYIGKRRLDWGTGMLWNPTNFHVQKDPFRTQNRLEGIFQASYSLLFDNGALQAYIFPDKRLEDFSYAVKYDYTGIRIDAGISFLQYKRYQQFGFELSYGGNLFTAYSEATIKNYSKSYKIDSKGTLVNPSTKRNQWWTEIVAGASFTPSAQISLRGEYRFREDYMNNSEIDYFKAALPQHSMIYDPISISKHTLFGSAEWKDIYDRYFIQLRTFYDPVSEQLIVSPLLIWKINNFQIEISSMVYNNSLALFNYQGSVLLSCYF